MYLKSHLNDCEILVVLITITRANRSVHGSGGPRGGAQEARLPPVSSIYRKTIAKT